MDPIPKFRFSPLGFSWVALHPKPVGVIYCIGGAFFGTFPQIFYRYLLKSLFDHGYTIVAIPYRFTFRHWSVAIGLLKDQSVLQGALLEEAKFRQYEYEIYDLDQEAASGKYFWLGHSLGCKYIALLELLTDLADKASNTKDPITALFGDCISAQERQRLEMLLATVDIQEQSIKNQKSVLMAPAIEGIEGAIPFLRTPMFSGLKRVLNRVGIRVEPSQAETFSLIQSSNLFNLTSLISFQQDTRVAAPTVQWLLDNLADRLLQSAQLQGRHLAPLGWLRGNPEIATTVQEFIASAPEVSEPVASSAPSMTSPGTLAV